MSHSTSRGASNDLVAEVREIKRLVNDMKPIIQFNHQDIIQKLHSNHKNTVRELHLYHEDIIWELCSNYRDTILELHILELHSNHQTPYGKILSLRLSG